MNKFTKSGLKFLGLVFFLGLLTYFSWDYLVILFKDPEAVKNYVNGFSFFAPLIFIFIFILQIILAPIPSQVVGTAGGYIFGFWLGLIYVLIGLFIGSWLAFFLSKKFGRPFVERFVKKEHLVKYDRLIEKKGSFILFLVFFIPFFPHDTFCFLAGLTKIKTGKFLFILAISRIPTYIVLAFIGTDLAKGHFLISGIIFIISLILAGLLFWKKDFLEAEFLNFVQKIREKKWAKKLKI